MCRKNDKITFQTCFHFFQISDLRFEISDFRFQVSDFRFQVSDFRFKICWGNPAGHGRGNLAGPPLAPGIKKLYKNPLDNLKVT